MKNDKKANLIIINISCILALLVVLLPLLMISQYNYPSADDWSYGAAGYKALTNGGGIFGVIASALETSSNSYMNWEGRFSNSFLAALQPGIWGEKYYGIVAWLMLGSIIFSEIFLCGSLLKMKSKEKAGWLGIPIIVPVLILQILYCPSPKESFYWYTGAINYTFIYGISLVLLALFMKLGINDYPKWKYITLSVISCFLAILIGGDNFGTSLSCVLTLSVLSGLFFFLNKKAFKRTWFLTVVITVSLLICIFAPGNRNRIAGNFGGQTKGAVYAVAMSLVRSFTNIYSWTDIKVILMLFFVLPFVWRAVKNINYSFRFPGLFTLITFGIYASQAAATMYVDGTTGGGRMAAVLFYSCHLWIVSNFCYWIGWLYKSQNKIKRMFEAVYDKSEKYILLYCAVLGIFLTFVIYKTDLREITSYQAYRNWRQGWAKQYAVEWEERLEILHDNNIKEVEFKPVSVPGELLVMYTDLQDEDGYIWVNSACAEYYDKAYIHVSAAEKQ
ncbi:MAG: DUF6056 family protein [Bacteroidales bacterium]|nr:DUF6056 family protein [Lachnoclostridium sp.]MCM1384477.1 DUF6056 family protein [Lachnoclostridium sp.]MCM1464022.1 DUF6056 family protein [Bacteroidales bacterium]